MSDLLKGTIMNMSFGEKFHLSAICPDGWEMKDRENGTVIVYYDPKDPKNEIGVRVFAEKDFSFPEDSHVTDWYKLLLDLFIPKETNLANVLLECFTCEYLNGAFCYNISSTDLEPGRFVRHSYISLSPSEKLVVEANVVNKEPFLTLVENFILSIGYKDTKREEV